MSEPDFSLVKSYCSIENTPIHIHNHQANQETDFFGSVLFSSLLTKKRTSDKKNKIPLFYWSIDDLQKIQKYNLVIWYFYRLYYVSVQFSHSVVYNSLRPHESQHARPPCPSPTPGIHPNSSIESVMPSSHLILCRPLLLPPIPPSIRVFSNASTLCMRWSRYWSFSFSISPSNEHSGLISFRMDWLDLLAVQGTLKSLLQHCSSKASILRHSAFFTVQPSHPYMTTGKTIALTSQTFVGNVMSLLLNMLSRLVITFLTRSKRLLTSWLPSPSAVILEH